MSGHALRDWRLIAGHENVVTDPAVISRAEVATFATSARIMAILRPANAGEAAACMAAAHRHGIDVHPVSRGLNWGLGSKTPAVSGAAVMELHRLDRIVGFDESSAFVTVEPGVTFRQLDAFLKARGSRLFLPAIGGSPDASIIGNAIQRGHGIGPSSQRADAIGSMEVVLRDGTVASTGYLPGSIFTGGETHRHGAGPSLAGLFQQGFMGIVTRMTLAGTDAGTVGSVLRQDGNRGGPRKPARKVAADVDGRMLRPACVHVLEPLQAACLRWPVPLA